MNKIIGLFLSLCVVAFCAQIVSLDFGTLAATGATAAKQVDAYKHTVAVVTAGSPTGCSIQLEGSIDGTTFFNLSGAQACTSSVMFHVVEEEVGFVRVNLTALAGGTSPTVSVKYRGLQ